MSDEENGYPIMGFDILPMSSHVNEVDLKVAAFLLMPDGATKKWDSINRRKFMQLIHQFQPRLLATDNPQEILMKKEDIVQFCKRLPPMTTLVHVNSLKNGKVIPLSSLFRKYDIKVRGKANPVQTARGLAVLAKKGIGTIIDPFEDETIIKVSQPRRTSKGGWSQQRYARQNEEVVLHAASKVKSILSNHQVAYDIVEVKTKYGLKFAKFHTFLPRTKLGEYFSGVNLKPARVNFESPARKVMVRKPLSMNFDLKHPTFQQRVLVGIDPGTTIGIAIMNLNGEIMDVISKREMTKSDIIQYVSVFGIPVGFCADVYPVPHLISKLAATFDAKIFSPRIELSKIDKRELSKQSGHSPSNNHEMDAMAAVIKAYNILKPKLEKIDRLSLSTKEKDLAKSLVIRGLTINDAVTAVQSLTSKEEFKPEIEQPEYQDEVKIQLQNRINNLLQALAASENTISYLREQVLNLETMLNEERKQRRNIYEALDKARDANIIDALSKQLVQEKTREIQYLREAIAKHTRKEAFLANRVKNLQKALWISLQEGKYPVKVLEVFSQKGLEKLEEQVHLKQGDVFLILDAYGGGPQTANKLVDIRPRMVFLKDTEFSPEAEAILKRYDIPFMDAEPYDIQVLDTVAMIDPLSLAKAIRDYEEIREQEKKVKTVEEILSFVENYRFERKRMFESMQKRYDDFDPEEYEYQQRKKRRESEPTEKDK